MHQVMKYNNNSIHSLCLYMYMYMCVFFSFISNEVTVSKMEDTINVVSNSYLWLLIVINVVLMLLIVIIFSY